MTAPTIQDLFDRLETKLRFRWLEGQKGGQRQLQPTKSGLQHTVAGPLNFIHPNSIQIIGQQELSFLASLGTSAYDDAIEKVFNSSTSAVILVDEACMAVDELRPYAQQSDTPLLTSDLPGHDLLDSLQYYLSDMLAARQTMHGVFMEVLGVGVHLAGDSAVGKSELALELLSRGHRLIADDAPEYARTAPDIVSGSCPPILRDFMEVRGLGLLNIRDMFGDNALKPQKYLRLIIRLRKQSELEISENERLQGSHSSIQLLDVDIPVITLPIAPGRNLAVLVEAAVRKHILQQQGINAVADFEARQREIMDKPGKQNP
ncbi:MAG: HPr(Ser) kinase/phosphatase [gamma proteobacterium symbiont of Bathyaustriella thionipta]|nr:HPr(Ser) kinase/phosphatase [gamma proteobacterium symbiont of Bathyaustriella thionipta]